MLNIIISGITLLFCVSTTAQVIPVSKQNKFDFIAKLAKKSDPRKTYHELCIDFIKRKLKHENPNASDKLLTALSNMIIKPANKKNIRNLSSKNKGLILQYYNALISFGSKKNQFVIELLKMCLKKSPGRGYTRFFIMRSLYQIKNKYNIKGQYQALFEKLILLHGVKSRDARVIYRMTIELEEAVYVSLAKKIKNKKNIDEWYKLIILGYANLIQACHVDGNSDAGKIHQEDYLRNAEKYLTQAWKNNPKRPEAATIMITVCARQKNKTVDDCVEWFKKAISLQFDYYPAYQKMSESITHKLGRNNELLYDLAVNCLQYGRDDTSVPEYGIKILLNIAAEIDDYRWQRVFMRPRVHQLLVKWTGKKVRLAKSDNAKNKALTIQALINIYTLNYKNANTIFNRLGSGVFDKEIFKLCKKTASPVISWNKPKLLINMFCGKYGKELINIQKEFFSGEKIEAMLKLSKIIEEEELSKKEKLFMIDLLGRIGISRKASLYKNIGLSPLNVGLFYKVNPAFIKSLLKLGIDYTITTPDNKRTALMIAARRNAQADLVDAFRDAGADFNLKDKYGWTALQHSIFMNNLPFTKRLLELGADGNTIDNTDNPLLLKVLLWRKDKIFNMLTWGGANIDICVSHNRTLLMRALQQNLDLNRLKMLIQHNINLERSSDQHWTVIYYAICYYHNPEVVKLLIKKGAEVNISDRDGNTPLIIAILWAKTPEKIKILLRAGANINEKNRAGMTPLIAAVITHKSLEYVKILVERGAMLNEVDNSKYTAYDWAIKKQKKDIAKYLSKHGALPASKIKK